MKRSIGVCFVLLVVLGGTGCATKKFVFSKLNPLERRVDDLESTTEKTNEEVAEVRTTASRAEEIGRGAQNKADEAAAEAARANDGVGEASRSAAKANEMAASNEAAVGTIEQKISNLDNFELLASETVLFDFESSDLNTDAQAQLDAAASRVPEGRPFLFEVRGFTDTTGSVAYNEALSSARASAVVRYLASKHGIPLRRIHMLGMGSDAAVADNKTREGRKQNRRVEVGLYAQAAGTTAASR